MRSRPLLPLGALHLQHPRRALLAATVLPLLAALTLIVPAAPVSAAAPQQLTAAPLNLDAAACPAAGVYGYAAASATNSAGQSYKWEVGVKFNGHCDLSSQVAYWSRQSCNVRCNYAAHSAALSQKFCGVTQSCTASFPWGSRDFGSSCACSGVAFIGAWHTVYTGSIRAAIGDHYVHFLTPFDVYSAHRRGCSNWWNVVVFQSAGGACPAVP